MQSKTPHIYIATVKPFSDREFFAFAYNFLSKERQKKTDRYLKDNDKYLSAGAELLLKCALKSTGVNVSPFDISEDENGKPFFKDKRIEFNISHSGEFVMCAVSKDKIGCDIEKISDINMKVAKKFFAEEEYADIISLDDTVKRNHRFFEYWTLKESYLKATGTGLKTPLDSFKIIKDGDISVISNGQAQEYYFKEFSIPNYKCAVCSKENLKDTKLTAVDLREEKQWI